MQTPVIRQIVVGPFDTMTYLVTCPETREAVVIDPAGEEGRIFGLIHENRATIRYILNTHGHADHTLANRALKEKTGAPVCMHEADDRFFARRDPDGPAVDDSGLPLPDAADIRLKHGDVITVGVLAIEVLHTPGHTPGSVCYFVDGNLFTGDTLFVGAAGRTDLAGASLDTLIQSIEKKILPLPGETVIWPGHDYGETPTSTIARETEENVYITDFIL